MSDLAFERDVRRPRPASTAWLRAAIGLVIVVATGVVILATAPEDPARHGVRTGFDEPANGRPGRRF